MLVHEGETRTPEADRALALSLAAVAGALNTAGFYAVGLYASNMTGNVSAISDRVGRGDLALAGQAGLLVILFVLGAATATLLIRRRRTIGPGAYAYGVGLEAILLVVVGGVAILLREPSRGHAMVYGLSFILGLQNAAVTKISGSRVRTTHVTGTMTDLGIELARWLDRGASGAGPGKPYDPARLRLSLITVGAFLGGGVLGVIAYRLVGVALLFAAAAILACLALPVLRR